MGAEEDKKFLCLGRAERTTGRLRGWSSVLELCVRGLQVAQREVGYILKSLWQMGLRGRFILSGKNVEIPNIFFDFLMCIFNELDEAPVDTGFSGAFVVLYANFEFHFSTFLSPLIQIHLSPWGPTGFLFPECRDLEGINTSGRDLCLYGLARCVKMFEMYLTMDWE